MNHIWEDCCPHGREYELRADDEEDGHGGLYEVSKLWDGEDPVVDCCPGLDSAWAKRSWRERQKIMAEIERLS